HSIPPHCDVLARALAEAGARALRNTASTVRPMVRSFPHPILLGLLTFAACSGGGEAAPMDESPVAGADGGNAGDGPETGTAADGVSATSRKPVFPLRVSGNGRYLVDDAGHPFLINQASSWGLIQSLS